MVTDSACAMEAVINASYGEMPRWLCTVSTNFISLVTSRNCLTISPRICSAVAFGGIS